MNRRASLLYGIFCLLALIVGFLFVFSMLWVRGSLTLVIGVVCMLFAFVFAPAVHEFGHVAFAWGNGMKLAYLKFFCFSWKRTGKRLRFAFANPFAPDETQVVPAYGGDMLKRAKAYTLGGLVFGGTWLLICVLCACLIPNVHYLWGLVPFSAYLVLLNIVPASYATGLTDMSVYGGLCKGEPVQKNMLSAMEIQGRLFAGESYAEIDEELYFNTPQIAEDEPLFLVMLDLRYRYYLDKGDLEKASECLNRLALLQGYLSEMEAERVAGELVYMHSLNGDCKRASECGDLCERYLFGLDITAKRILCAYTYAFGDKEKAIEVRRIVLNKLDEEWISGHAKSEKKLLLALNKTEP